MHARFNENSFLRPIPNDRFTLKPPVNYKLTRLQVLHDGKNSSHGVSITNPENKITIMYFGGNMFTIEKNGKQIVDVLTQLNVNVVIFDHRGYGQSTGVPTVALLQSDAIDNYDYIRKRQSGKIILHGQSLGSFEAGAVAEHRKIDALTLESSATNIDDWIKKVMPWYIKAVTKTEISEELRLLNNKRVVSQFTKPLMILVGKKDKQTPVKLSEELFSYAISENKKLHILEGSSHNNVPINPEFLSIYQKFINGIM